MKLRRIEWEEQVWEEQVGNIKWNLQLNAGGVSAAASLYRDEFEEVAHYEVCDEKESLRRTGNPLKLPVSVHYQWDQAVKCVRQLVIDEKLRMGETIEPLRMVNWTHETTAHDGADWLVRLSGERLRVYRNGVLHGLVTNGEDTNLQNTSEWPKETKIAFDEALEILKRDRSASN